MILDGSLRFLAVFGGSWLFLVVQMVNLWFFVGLSDSFLFFVIVGGNWPCLAVLCGS